MPLTLFPPLPPPLPPLPLPLPDVSRSGVNLGDDVIVVVVVVSFGAVNPGISLSGVKAVGDAGGESETVLKRKKSAG